MTGRQTIWDPLRKREVALTPEERVRQWFISVLRDDMKVPAHMMMSEVALALGGKPWRADILIYDRAQKPLAVVECKRPEVVIDRAVLDQAVRYNMVLDVRLLVLTNGKTTYMIRRSPGGPEFMETVPTYEEMLAL